MRRCAQRVWLRGTLLLALGALSALAQAHKVSTAYLNLEGDANDAQVFHGQWAISLLDLDFVLGLDADGNGKVTWGELRARGDAIADYALAHLTIRGDGLACTLERGAQSVTDYTDGSYDLLAFDAVCERGVPSALSVDYRLFYDVDPSHRGIITLRDGAESASAVSAPSDPAINSASIRIELPKAPLWHRLAAPTLAGLVALFDPVASLLVVIFLVAGSALGARASAPRPRSQMLAALGAFLLGVLVMVLCARWLPVLASPLWRVWPISIAAIAALTLLVRLSDRSRCLVAATIGLLLGAWLAQPLRALDLPAAARIAWLGSYFFGYAIAAIAVASATHSVSERLLRSQR